MSVAWLSRERTQAEVAAARAAWKQYQNLPAADRDEFLADLVNRGQSGVLAAISAFLRNEGFARYNRPCPAGVAPEAWRQEAADYLRQSDQVAALAERAAG